MSERQIALRHRFGSKRRLQRQLHRLATTVGRGTEFRRADAMAQLLAEAKGIDKSRLLGNLLEKTLLGEGHALKVAAMRLARVGIVGIDRRGE